MAFVRLKASRGSKNYVLVENKRVGGKVRQKTIAYLGTEETGCDTVEKAISYLEKQIPRSEKLLGESREKLAELFTKVEGYVKGKANWYEADLRRYETSLREYEAKSEEEKKEVREWRPWDVPRKPNSHSVRKMKEVFSEWQSMLAELPDPPARPPACFRKGGLRLGHPWPWDHQPSDLKHRREEHRLVNEYYDDAKAVRRIEQSIEDSKARLEKLKALS